ncbi:MAG: RNase P subunit p30 family protein [Halobacteriales archaeon]
MYEAVLARPAGPSTVARLASTAADYGYEGVVVSNPPDDSTEYDAAAIREAYGVDVVAGLTLAPEDPASAGGAIGHHRPDTTVLCVRGGESINGYAVREPRVDVLVRPMANGGDLDHVDVRAAADNGVRLAADLGPVLRETGPSRSSAIAGLRKLRELVADADAPYVVTAGGESHLELRAPRELAAVASTAGFDRAAVERGLAEWGRLAERNRERLSEASVAPGVRVADGPELDGDAG